MNLGVEVRRTLNGINKQEGEEAGKGEGSFFKYIYNKPKWIQIKDVTVGKKIETIESLPTHIGSVPPSLNQLPWVELTMGRISGSIPSSPLIIIVVFSQLRCAEQVRLPVKIGPGSPVGTCELPQRAKTSVANVIPKHRI